MRQSVSNICCFWFRLCFFRNMRVFCYTQMMTRADRIKDKLERELTPIFLSLIDESHGHSVPKGAESHFNLILVSSEFIGKSRVQRQRQVYQSLGEELRAGLHALTMKTLTPDEWNAAEGKLENPSPRCRGGQKGNEKL
jgi:BolA family transcriptional regulator, general stress-responsive regulator